MTATYVVLAYMFIGVTLYALLAGADFGAGVWDLLAGNATRGRRTRELIAHVIGPVWEANHVWLIFILVILWTGFPKAFGPIMSTLYIPLTFAAIGIMFRGAGFAFRKEVVTTEQQRIFGATFAFASLLTPFFLGTFVGGIVSGRVPADGTGRDIWSSWWNPTGILAGVIAVLTCTYLASVFLCRDAQRNGLFDLTEQFRTRALGVGIITGTVAIAGMLVLREDAQPLYRGLTSEALPLVGLSVLCGTSSLALLWIRHFVWVRVTAALAVVSILWAWAVAQYPYIIEDELTIRAASGDIDTMRAVAWSLTLGGLVLIPSLVYLGLLLRRGSLTAVDGVDTEVAPQR